MRLDWPVARHRTPRCLLSLRMGESLEIFAGNSNRKLFSIVDRGSIKVLTLNDDCCAKI